MNLTFTFIASFRGGLYCSQVQADSIEPAILSWINNLRIEKSQIKHLGEKTIDEIERQAVSEDSKAVLLHGLVNVWCKHYLTKKGSILVNIVQTDTA